MLSGADDNVDEIIIMLSEESSVDSTPVPHEISEAIFHFFATNRVLFNQYKSEASKLIHYMPPEMFSFFTAFNNELLERYVPCLTY
jgi:hypothetical protein